MRGPCGGYEYTPGSLDQLTLLVAGAGITPALQLIRCVAADPLNKININLLYYSESFSEILYYEELQTYSSMYPIIFYLYSTLHFI